MRSIEAGRRVSIVEDELMDALDRIAKLEEAIFEPLNEKIVELAEFRLPDLAAKAIHVHFGRYMPMVPLAAEHMTKELAQDMVDEYNERMK